MQLHQGDCRLSYLDYHSLKYLSTLSRKILAWVSVAKESFCKWHLSDQFMNLSKFTVVWKWALCKSRTGGKRAAAGTEPSFRTQNWVRLTKGAGANSAFQVDTIFHVDTGLFYGCPLACSSQPHHRVTAVVSGGSGVCRGRVLFLGWHGLESHLQRVDDYHITMQETGPEWWGKMPVPPCCRISLSDIYLILKSACCLLQARRQ